MLNPKQTSLSSLVRHALTLLVFSMVTCALPAAVVLQSAASPGTASFNVTFLVEDHRLNRNDVFSHSQAGTGAVSSIFSNIQWIGSFGSLHGLAASALDGDTNLADATTTVVALE